MKIDLSLCLRLQLRKCPRAMLPISVIACKKSPTAVPSLQSCSVGRKLCRFLQLILRI